MPEREKHSPVPPVPSRTPAARRLAQAKYCENHKEEEAEKSRIWIARHRASIKANPEHVQEQKDRKKCADKAYREKERKQMHKRELSRVIRWKKKKILPWNTHFGPTEDKMSSSKGFQIHCGGTRMGM
ncbi:hypothetical protein K438DRAFT_1843761 [Mycena galopus ATCC 62051]|nr:hypothetical protein K438DRAFT_1843761 [Mycena galopus ATCC 62051]